MGGFYGARLQRAGCETHFLLHSDYEHVRQHGLVVESKEGDFTLPRVNAWRSAADMPPCDVVLVALKTTQNALLPELLPAAASPESVVLMMQNGLGVEEEAARVVPGRRILGGLCFLCSNKVGPGHIRHLDYGHVKLAEYDPQGKARGITESMRQIGDDLRQAGISVELSPDLVTARWQKLVWNIPYNGLSVILDANTAELMASAPARALAEALMREVAVDAAALGRVIEPRFIEKMLDDTARMTPYRASMKIDFDERRPMEVESIYGAPLRAAQAAGAASPLLETLYRQLSFLNERVRASG